MAGPWLATGAWRARVRLAGGVAPGRQRNSAVLSRANLKAITVGTGTSREFELGCTRKLELSRNLAHDARARRAPRAHRAQETRPSCPEFPRTTTNPALQNKAGRGAALSRGMRVRATSQSRRSTSLSVSRSSCGHLRRWCGADHKLPPSTTRRGPSAKGSAPATPHQHQTRRPQQNLAMMPLVAGRGARNRASRFRREFPERRREARDVSCKPI